MTFSIFILNFRATVNYLGIDGLGYYGCLLMVRNIDLTATYYHFLIFKIMYNIENIVQKDIFNIYIQSYRNLINQIVRILNMVLLHIIAN